MECVFFLEGLEGCEWMGTPERCLVGLGEQHVVFLHLSASIGSAGLGFPEGVWHDPQRGVSSSLVES